MTANQRKVAVGVITIILGASIIGAARTVQDNVIFRPEFAAHVARDSGRIEAIIDILCADHPTHRRCR